MKIKVLCFLRSENKTKENETKKFRFAEDVVLPTEAGMICTINGNNFFHSQRIPGLEIRVHHAISLMTILAFMTSLTSMN